MRRTQGWLGGTPRRDPSKENGNYSIIIGYILGLYYRLMEKRMETTIL